MPLIFNDGKLLFRNGRLAFSRNCCCGQNPGGCLPRIPPTVYAHITGDGGAACLTGDYALTWNAGLRRFEAVVLTCAEPLLLCLFEVNPGGSPCTPDADLEFHCQNLGGRPTPSTCLAWVIKCASLGVVNSAVWLEHEINTPAIVGSCATNTNTCVSADPSNPEIYVIINETP